MAFKNWICKIKECMVFKMNFKTKIKVFIDIAMSIVLFICMSYQFVGQENHEISGAVMLVLFILHHILNIRWFKGLLKGKYSPGRIFLTVIDFAMLATMLLVMLSGIRMSRTVFAFLDLKFMGMETARSLHMIMSYLGFLLKRNFLSYITLQIHFVFFDYTEPVIFYVLDLMAIMMLMGSVGYYVQKLLTTKRREQ